MFYLFINRGMFRYIVSDFAACKRLLRGGKIERELPFFSRALFSIFKLTQRDLMGYTETIWIILTGCRMLYWSEVEDKRVSEVLNNWQ